MEDAGIAREPDAKGSSLVEQARPLGERVGLLARDDDDLDGGVGRSAALGANALGELAELGK